MRSEKKVEDGSNKSKRSMCSEYQIQQAGCSKIKTGQHLPLCLAGSSLITLRGAIINVP